VRQAPAQPARLRALVVHGSNLNLLGPREPQIYGPTTLADINERLAGLAKELNVELVTMQSNTEGAIVDAFQ
jgi:3-dehydroquinate dehydratase-2